MGDAYEDLFAKAAGAPPAPDAPSQLPVGAALTAPDAVAPSGAANNEPNAYDALFKAANPLPQANANLIAAQQSTPDQTAANFQTAQQTNTALPAVEADPAKFQSQAQLQQNQQVLEYNPRTAQWASDNPLAVRMANDDFQKLGMIEQATTALSSGFQGAVLGNQLGREGALKQVENIAGVSDSGTDQNITSTQQQLGALPSLTGGMGAVQRFTGFVSGLLDNFIKGGSKGVVVGTVAGGAAGLAVGGVGALPGAVGGGATGLTVGFNADMAVVASGNAYLKMQNIRGADGQPLSEAGKQIGSIATGIGTYLLGSYGGALESKLLSGSAEDLAAQAINQAVTKPTFTAALSTFAGNTAKASLSGGAVMTAMEATSIIGEEMAKAVSPGQFSSDPDEMVDRLSDAFLNGVLMVGALHAGTGALALHGDFGEAMKANQNAQMFGNIMSGAADSKLRNRNLDAFQSFMQAQTDGTPVENLFVPADKVRELYQSMNVDPNAPNDPIFGFVPDMAKQLSEAEGTGGDVVIPTSDFVTHLAGTDVAKQLMPDLRVGADSMSVNEAKDFNDAYQQRLAEAKAQVDQQAGNPDQQTSGQQIATQVRQQALQAGRGDAEATRAAALVSARYTARGERLGIDPMDAFKRSGLEIAKGKQEEPDEATFNQSPVEGPGVDLKDIKNPVEGTPAEKLDQIHTLTAANKPLVSDIMKTVDEKFGTQSKDSVKSDETIVSKAKRPSVLAVKPWHGIEHLRDTYRFETVLDSIKQLPDVLKAVQDKGVQIVKADTAKVMNPKEFGWRVAAYDLRMPNGQLVEWYLPIKEMKEAKKQGHVIYEEGRDLDPNKPGDSEKLKDIAARSREHYGDAWESYLARTGEDDSALTASLAKADALASEQRDMSNVSEPLNQDASSHLPDADLSAEKPSPEPETMKYGGLSSDAQAAGLTGDDGATGDLDISDTSRPIVRSGEGSDKLSLTDAKKVLEQPSRGSIRFEQSRAVISLFEHADHSTLIHESGHLWLEELVADAGAPGASDQLKSDLQTVMDYLGIKSSEDIGVDQHEVFARTAEAYLMEGKAPSNALAAVFSRFKTWLTKIYSSIKSLNVPINDDIRGVFDRLLATDQELAEAKEKVGLKPAFKTREEAGMTSAEWKAYNDAVDRANTQAESVMLEKMMAQLRKERSAQWKAEADTLRPDVTAQVDKRPDIEALNLLTRNKLADGTEPVETVKLSRKVVESDFGGKKTVTDLPKGSTSVDGVHPDHVAEMLGFNSGGDLIDSLTGLEQQQRELRLQEGEKRGIRQYLIDQGVKSRMDEKHPDMLDDGSIKDEAMAAIHSQKRAEMLAMELRYLKRSNAQTLLAKGEGRRAVGEEKTKADWDAAEADLVNQIERAKADAAAKEKLDALQEKLADTKAKATQALADLKQKLGDAKATERWNAAEDNTTRAALRESVAVSKGMVDALRAHVKATLSNKKIDDLSNSGQYLRAERKAAADVQRAILAKDFKEAAAAKQRQLISNLLYTEAKGMAKTIDSGTSMMQRLAKKSKFDGIDQAFTDQIHALLERWSIKTTRDPDELARSGVIETSLEKFADDQFQRGFELPITPFLTGAGGDLHSLNFQQFGELTDMVRSLQTAGRESQIVRVYDQEFDKEYAVHEMVTALGDMKQREPDGLLGDTKDGFLKDKITAAGAFLRSLDAALLKTEQIFDWMDNNNPDGPFNRYIFRPLKEAAHAKNRMLTDMVDTTFREAKRSMPKEWMGSLDERLPNKSLVDPETGAPFKVDRKTMISMALNWGTEDSATKLARGYNWDPRTVQQFLNENMTKADWDFVGHLWDGFEKLGPALDALQRRVTGVGIEFVEGRSIQTRFGEVGGKYFPLVYDAGKSVVAERNLERSSTGIFEGQYPRATTRNGSAISRVQGVNQPVNLSLDIIPWKMGQTVHDLAFREAIMSADKLLSDKRVIAAMDSSLGPEYRKLMRPWLQHIANSANINDQALAFADRFLNKARANFVVAGIGFRIGTMVKHGSAALFNSAVELGPRWGMQGYKEMMGTPQQMARTWNWVLSMSDEMKFRKNQYDRDLSQNLEGVTDPNWMKEGYGRLVEYSHLGVATLDMMSAVPLWIGAFRKAQSEDMSEADAVYFAEKTVRKAHGAQGITDKAAIQTSKSQLWKMTTMFYGFFNHIYNRQRDTVRVASQIPSQVKQGDFRGAGKSLAQTLARTTGYVLLPALAGALYQSGGPNENKGEGWLDWAGKAVAAELPAGIPILRDIAKAVIEGRDYEPSPLTKTIESARGTGADLASAAGLRDKPSNPAAIKHAMETFGYLTGAPTGQAGAAAQFLWNVHDGDESPSSLKDWIEGLTKGKISQQ